AQREDDGRLRSHAPRARVPARSGWRRLRGERTAGGRRRVSSGRIATPRAVRDRSGRARHGEPLRAGRGTTRGRDDSRISSRQLARARSQSRRGSGSRASVGTTMTLRRTLPAALAVITSLVASLAFGHTGGSTGYASIGIAGQNVRYSLTLWPAALPPAIAEELRRIHEGDEPSRERLLGVIRDKIGIVVRGRRCAPGRGSAAPPSPRLHRSPPA